MIRTAALPILCLIACLKPAGANPPSAADNAFVGSDSCRSCHADFFAKWSTSFHRRTLLTVEDAQGELARLERREPLRVGSTNYQFKRDAATVRVVATAGDNARSYRVSHAFGGRDVWYFLTPVERGRLQVLPIGFDVRRQEWFDVPASAGRRHADGTPAQDGTPFDWRDRGYTFNAACIDCHVSQYAVNYSVADDTYHTTWREAGINCETCHGPAGAHVRAFTAAQRHGEKPADAHIIRMGAMKPVLRDAACATCHAKRITLTDNFQPGDSFFDHFDLLTLEDHDFYPDGRELGETYTYTTWLLNPCVRRGGLDCLHCHTSSGRYRFTAAHANDACLPCHLERVRDVAAHSHHASDGPAGHCVACHMPQSEFARMRRTDHSLRPPMPAATKRFGSPNACNNCHKNRSADWANAQVATWHDAEYQQSTLEAAALVTAARAQDWSRLDAMAAYVADAKHDEIFATALVRLAADCADPACQPMLLGALSDPSPLVRSSAALGMRGNRDPQAVKALIGATSDPVRLVRVRAAAALAGAEDLVTDAAGRAAVAAAQREFESAMNVRPDHLTTRVNLGNYFLDRKDPSRALAAFTQALRLEPDSAGAHVNVALACDAANDAAGAEQHLRKAVALDATSAAAQLNLGLLLGGQGRIAEARAALRAALDADPRSAPAAYNLAILSAEDDPEAAVTLLEKASALAPFVPRYAWALAFYLQKSGESDRAVATLEQTLARHPGFADGYALLAEIQLQRHDVPAAHATYAHAAGESALPADARAYFAAQAQALPAGD